MPVREIRRSICLPDRPDKRPSCLHITRRLTGKRMDCLLFYQRLTRHKSPNILSDSCGCLHFGDVVTEFPIRRMLIKVRRQDNVPLPFRGKYFSYFIIRYRLRDFIEVFGLSTRFWAYTICITTVFAFFLLDSDSWEVNTGCYLKKKKQRKHLI